MRYLIIILFAVWPFVIQAATDSQEGCSRFDAGGEPESGMGNVSPGDLERYAEHLQQPAVLALYLGHLGAYPMPAKEQQVAQARPWPATDFRSKNKVEFPFAVHVSIESRDGTYRERVLVMRQDNRNSPWKIVDHYLAGSNGAKKTPQDLPLAELQTRARLMLAADLEKGADCNNSKK